MGAPTAPWCLLLVAGFAVAQNVPTDYRLHAGDKLDVSVWKETELQKPAIVIAPDGHFSFPLAGQITAAGRTVAEVRQEIETKLAKYMPDPVVTVGITDVAGNVAYVIGQVTKPGSFVMNPRINVLQALSSWPAAEHRSPSSMTSSSFAVHRPVDNRKSSRSISDR
jgi:protein involved in polysaccharide export with SLBB domain